MTSNLLPNVVRGGVIIEQAQMCAKEHIHCPYLTFCGAGVMGPQKMLKKWFLSIFGGPITSPFKFFSDSEGTFIKQTF